MSSNTMTTAKALTFGTELEYTRISRERAAKAIHAVIGGTVRYTGGCCDAWTVTAPDGKKRAYVGTVAYMPAAFGGFCASVVLRNLPASR